MSVITIDFETFYRKGEGKTPSIKAQGNWAYTHDPEFEALIVSVCDGEQSWAGEPKDFNWEALRGHTLVAHNAGFDRAVYRRLVEDGAAPAGLDADWRCSADMASYVLGVRNLKDAMAAGFGLDISKDVRDEMSGLRVADMKAKGIWTRAVEYARSDAVHEYRLWTKCSPVWPDREQRISAITLEQRFRGVAVDRERLTSAIADLREALRVCESNLPWIARGRAPTSPNGVYDECRSVGIPCPPTKKADEEGFLSWEAKYRETYPWVGLVGNHRSIAKVLSQLEMLESRLRPDGRFEFDLLYFGGHTGRWSSGGFNMQNMRRTPLVVDWDTGGVIEWRDHKKTPDERGSRRVVDVRGLFVPAPGHVFVDCDLAQIEPRVLNWLARNDDVLAEIAKGMSVYEVFARKAGRWTEPGPLKVGDPKLYTMSKVQVLQLGYQSGWKTFQTTAFADYDVVLTEDEAKAAVEEYRNANPKIVELWGKLDSGLRTSVGSDYEVCLPSGRSMKYKDVRNVLMTIGTDENGKVRKKWQTTVKVAGHFGRTATYGGKITENVVQAISRDVFAEGLIRAEDAGVRTIWTIHDQCMSEVPEGSADEACAVVREAFARTPGWLPGCPVDAEAFVCERYSK